MRRREWQHRTANSPTLIVALAIVAIWLPDGAASAQPTRSSSRSTKPLLTGVRFRQALGQRVSVAWVNASADQLTQHTIRRVTRQAEQLWRTSILLDRRIDPSTELQVKASGRTVRDVLGNVAREAQAGMSVVGHTVYMGPASEARVLRTLVALRDSELETAVAGAATRTRVAQLRRLATVQYADLSTPRTLLLDVARRWNLEIGGIDAVPHDLWAGSRWPAVKATEALSLILIQYGLTFRWTRGAKGIEICSPTRPVTMAANYKPRAGRTAEAMKRVQKELPGVDVQKAVDGRVTVRGTYEELVVARSLVTTGRRPVSPTPTTNVTPLSRRRFTLKVAQARVADVMVELEKSGVRFVYDAEALKRVDIDLASRVAIDVKQVSARVFFKQLFGPIGLSASFQGLTVTLTPSQP